MPIHIPIALKDALLQLTRNDLRRSVSIMNDNPFIFASSNSKENHVEGYQELRSITVKLDLEKTITSTRNRHFIATQFNKRNMSVKARSAYLNHIGHSSRIDEDYFVEHLLEQQDEHVEPFLFDNDVTTLEAGPSTVTREATASTNKKNIYTRIINKSSEESSESDSAKQRASPTNTG